MKVYAIYFSPGGTTKRCVLNVAEGFREVDIIEINMNLEENRRKKYTFDKNDVVILGMPTMSKLFGLPDDIMSTLKGNMTPFIGLVTCGNGYYGKGLISMNKAMSKQGFKIIGAGGFVGQYSFNKSIAAGRPDQRDRQEQVKMGASIYEKILRGDRSFNHKLKIDWPEEGAFSTIKCGLVSSLPGSGSSLPKSMRGLKVADTCISCKKCIKACPMDAISYKNEIVIDIDKCIGCFACGNACPVNAISHTSKTMLKSVDNVTAFRSDRKPNNIFI